MIQNLTEIKERGFIVQRAKNFKDLLYIKENERLMNLSEEIGKLLNAYSKAILSSIS